MDLMHYHWGHADTALQFFDLASNMSQQLPPLHFDPVIYASFNNLAQVHLQYGRTSDAMELLQDAMTRGNVALVASYFWSSSSSCHYYGTSSTTFEEDINKPQHHQQQLSLQAADGRKIRRLRHKLARTI
jgi:hypothetical protein